MIKTPLISQQKILCISLMESFQYMPPLGIAAINGALKIAGYESDAVAEFIKTDIPEREAFVYNYREIGLDAVSHVLEHIEKVQPTVICYSIYDYNKTSTLLLSRTVRERHPQIKQILGGPQVKDLLVNDEHSEILNSTFDYAVKGEGEEVVIKIMQQIDGLHPEPVYGAMTPPYQASNYFLEKFDFKTQVQDMNTLPLPDFGSSPRFSRYFNEDGWWAGIPIQFSRGCSGNCSFCNVKMYSKAVRWRNAQHLMFEMAAQSKRYQTTRFMVVDDDPLSLVARKDTDELFELLKKSPVRFELNFFNAKLDRALVDESRIQLLREAGLNSVVFGFESASEEVRKHMNKYFPLDESIRILTNFKKNEIKVHINLIYCYPSETEEDFQITLDWVRDHGHLVNHIGANIFFNNPVYVSRFPESIRLVPPKPEEPMGNWENDLINSKVMWSRYERLHAALKSRPNGTFGIAAPTGQYSS
jgi:radical SAM superfamily enzyme YgiQ (UPF0313 family)